jgi:hypothetical protein
MACGRKIGPEKASFGREMTDINPSRTGDYVNSMSAGVQPQP